MRIALAGCLAALTATIMLSAPPAQATPCADPDIACTDLGPVRGTAEGGTLAFKGIPYAAPPVGALRWRPPAPARPWDGVRDGKSFGPICPQIVNGAVVGDEDCLTLNVWRPRAKPARPLPVMVWLTGGGNHSLSGQGTASFGGVKYNGDMLVPESVVFVSFNSRLGALGYLAHPALDAERAEHVSGNYGNLDQIEMLRWLKRNIRAFGGDPKRVFLFGTSAGGGNICALMTSPLARRLFQGAAMESSVPTGCEIQTLADAENGTGRSVVDRVGCAGASDIAACLRSKSATEMVAAVPGTFGVLPRIYGPNVDGHVFPDQPLRRIAQRKHQAMPVIIGNTSEETMQFVDAAGPVNDEASLGGRDRQGLRRRQSRAHHGGLSDERLCHAARRLRQAHHRRRIHLPEPPRRAHTRRGAAAKRLSLSLQPSPRRRPRAEGARRHTYRRASLLLRLERNL